MTNFHYRDNTLFIEEIPVEMLAKHYGTPCYLYSRAAMTQNFTEFNDNRHFDRPHQICYAVKANSNVAVLNILARLGSGFDIVSKGELARVLKAGGSAQKTIFSGVGKTEAEIEYALKMGVFCFNIESESELQRIQNGAARLSLQAPIALRVNPDVDAKTHPYISTGLKDNKFGIEPQLAVELYKLANTLPNVKILGLACHIGSQVTQLTPFIEMIKSVKQLIKQLADSHIFLSHLDIGGGLGIRYQNETPPTPQSYIQAVLQEIGTEPLYKNLTIILEPGRAIVANAGILVTQLELIKKTPYKNFAIVDAGMNDLLRPALYDAWQNIIPVTLNPSSTSKATLYDVVGPLCETGDFIGKDRALCIQEGDYLAVEHAGAYGFSMSSTYNSRARPAEVMVDGSQHYLIRAREDWESLSALESLLPA